MLSLSSLQMPFVHASLPAECHPTRPLCWPLQEAVRECGLLSLFYCQEARDAQGTALSALQVRPAGCSRQLRQDGVT